LVTRARMDVNCQLEESGQTPLHLLLARVDRFHNHMDRWWDTVWTLRRLGADLDIPDSHGACGMCVIAALGRPDLLPRLVSEDTAGWGPEEITRRVNVSVLVVCKDASGCVTLLLYCRLAGVPSWAPSGCEVKEEVAFKPLSLPFPPLTSPCSHLRSGCVPVHA
jgi:hypothetical protein